MVNFPCGPLGGVGVEDGLGVGSLILTPLVFLPTTFLSFFGGGRAAATFRLLARVLDDLALGLAKESSVELVLGARSKIGMAKIELSPLKPRIVEAKLSKACTIAYAENKYSRKNLKINGVLPYHVPFHSEMVDVNLLGSRPTTGIAEYFL
jgi:hypothetical protein